jgi:hypothetical protein
MPRPAPRAAIPAGSTWTVPPSWDCAMLIAAACSGEEPAALDRSAPGAALRLSFGRSEMARNLTARPRAVTAIANP